VQTYFTATANWSKLFRLQLTCALFLVIALFSLLFYNSTVLLLTYAASFLIASLRFLFNVEMNFKLDKQIIRENLRIGFPIMIAGLIYFLFQTTDRLIVSRNYSKEEFGFYSFAWLLAMSLNMIVNLGSELMLQRAATRYTGISGNNAVFKFLLRYSLLIQAGLIAITLVLMIGIYYLLPVYLSAYVDAIPVIRNILIAYVIQQLGLAAANYYLIVGRQRLYNILLIVACILNAGVLLGGLMFSQFLPSLEKMSSLYILSSVLYIVLLYIPLRREILHK
jgi:O-antigen/teichoic acid export membrane protein